VSSDSVVQFLLRCRRRVLLVACLLAVVCGVRTVVTYSNLRSDLEELLPRTAPSVLALETARARLPGLRHLGVVVDTGGPANADAALAFIADLERRVAEYPSALVGAVRSGVAEERRFIETYALQFIEPGDLRQLREAVETRHRWEVGRALGVNLLDESEEPPPHIPLRELQSKYAERVGGKVQFPDDRFLSEDQHTAVLVVQSGSRETSLDADAELLARVQRDAAALGFPDAYAPGMRLGFAGDVATRVEEARGLAMDLGVSGGVVWVLVIASIIWFYRSAAAIFILGVPVVVSTLYTFGLVALPPIGIRHLNTNTAFLASILVGNGINSGIILLARYQEQLRHGDPARLALTTAVQETFRPTLAAALAAAAAYASLSLTEFRGFSQFGIIGAVGMVVSWLVTYTLVPILIGYLGTRMGSRAREPLLAPRFAAIALGRPRLVLLAAAACVLLSLLGVGMRYGSWVETDFSRLRRADSWENGERYWGKRMDQTLQRYLTPSVLLADTEEQAERVAEAVTALAERHAAGGLIASVRSAAAVLPPEREQSIAEGRRLRAALTPSMLERLAPDERARIEILLSDNALRPLTAADIPATLAAGLRDADGRLGRNVLVFPTVGGQTWEADRIESFAHDLREAASSAGPGVVATGPLLLSNDLIDAMRRDGPRATAAALLVVLAVVALAFRSVRLSAIAVGALLVGVVAMLGLGAWSGQRLNFSNFVALPLTFGIAADYALNVLQRYQSSGDLEAAIGDTGGAVALCSATTVVGFGSLLVAQNGALFSFGALAVAGELTGLCTAALVLPAFLAWRPNAARARRLPPTGGEAESSV
jgi:predicted RND superfamily exporter protein